MAERKHRERGAEKDLLVTTLEAMIDPKLSQWHERLLGSHLDSPGSSAEFWARQSAIYGEIGPVISFLSLSTLTPGQKLTILATAFKQSASNLLADAQTFGKKDPKREHISNLALERSKVASRMKQLP